jgi:hypothetical protein
MNFHDVFARLRRRTLRSLLSADDPRLDPIARFAAPKDEVFPSCNLSGTFADIVKSHGGSVIHKWEHYLPLYDRYFGPFRNEFVGVGGHRRPLRFLEIGVFRGGSLEVWRRFFGPDAVIAGIDIDPACARFDGVAAMVRIGSQDDPEFLRQVVAEMGGVDAVLDDGSHVASHQRASFGTLFPLLSESGVYMIEDTHTAYWPGWHEGGLRRRGTAIEFA